MALIARVYCARGEVIVQQKITDHMNVPSFIAVRHMFIYTIITSASIMLSVLVHLPMTSSSRSNITIPFVAIG